MAEPEELDEDLFADLYEGDDVPVKPVQQQSQPQQAAPVPAKADPIPSETPQVPQSHAVEDNHGAYSNGISGNSGLEGVDSRMGGSGWEDGNANDAQMQGDQEDNYGPIGIKEDGKMFIGGLNWETTEQSLKDYFSQFGEVTECTVMRDSATGRSRGFGFLTFKDPKCVNIVMVKEHYLDGKIIDPKRAIPREEQERTSKIFVGGVSQEATEHDFKTFFMQFGRVVDATLMMDKDTGRPRGFGFVTFDGDAAVDAALAGPLEILGKPIEVKRAQPRGNLRDDEDKKFGRGRGDGKFGRTDGGGDGQDVQQQQGAQGGNTSGMSPAMMAQYWQRMQQYFAMMQQQMAANMAQGQQQQMQNQMGMGQMNPAMMGMMAGGGGGGNGGNGGNPGAMQHGDNSPMSQNGMNQMNPAMMQQMNQMAQMQMQQQQAGQQGGFQNGPNNMPGAVRPGFNAHEQLAFEQRKYEEQQVRRMQQQQQYAQFNQNNSTSWEGMYEDVPQPPMPPTGPAASRGSGMQQGGRYGSPAGGRPGPQRGVQGATPPVQQPNNAPANAPTGPKNAGKPGANYRGGGRGAHRGFHPYARG